MSKLRRWMIADAARRVGDTMSEPDMVRYMRDIMPRILHERMKATGRNMEIHYIINHIGYHTYMWPLGYYTYWQHKKDKPRLHRPNK